MDIFFIKLAMFNSSIKVGLATNGFKVRRDNPKFPPATESWNCVILRLQQVVGGAEVLVTSYQAGTFGNHCLSRVAEVEDEERSKQRKKL